MNKTAEWSTDNKIKVYEEKSKVMLLTRRKRKEQKKVLQYVNNKTVPQVHKVKYLGKVIDYKKHFGTT